MTLRLGLPKGRMEAGVLTLLGDAGIRVRPGARGYRPDVSLPETEAKLLKPQNVVQIVAAAPGELPDRRIVVASEYERLARAWIAERRLAADFVRSYGATEVFPPEDADVIIDNTATGSTLEANGLRVVEVLMQSSTRLYANPRALEDATRRRRVEDLVLLLRSVLDARQRVMLEVNASAQCLNAVVAALPAMRRATVAPLFGNNGYAVKAAVPRDALPVVIPAVKAAGGTDVVVSRLAQIVP